MIGTTTDIPKKLNMGDEWKNFLVSIGGHADPEGLVHFADPRAEVRAANEGNVLVTLSQLGWIRVGGINADDFLNGQLSNDPRLLDAQYSQLSAYCNPQGRALAVLRVFRRGAEFWLQLPAELTDGIAKRLRIFVLRAKVTLDVGADLTPIGLIGPDAAAILETASLPVPQAVDRVATRNDITVMKVPGIRPRFEILGPIAAAKSLWQTLARQALPVGPQAWVWHDIQAGLPAALQQTSAVFVPQMLNLDVLGGINFKKGCYPGQEIVARVHYRGRPKQRMYRARVHAQGIPTPGEPIYSTESREQSVGNVVQATAAPDGGYDLLAVVQIVSAASGELRLGSTQGPNLALETLPYSLEPGVRRS